MPSRLLVSKHGVDIMEYCHILVFYVVFKVWRCAFMEVDNHDRTNLFRGCAQVLRGVPPKERGAQQYKEAIVFPVNVTYSERLDVFWVV